MGRPILLFGNGLGMALDADAFALGGAIRRVWSDPETLDETQKALIRACLPADREDPAAPPRGEEELAVLHRVLAACDLLGGVETAPGSHWLSEHGRCFPLAIRQFIHRVAATFHGTYTLPSEFCALLDEFIRERTPHVATLNYDALLYGHFVDERICHRTDGTLVDGLRGQLGFDPEILCSTQLGNYLHLHGSPLFRTDADGKIRKWQRNEVIPGKVERSPHLVLTHVDGKLEVIKQSRLLKAYWDRFSDELPEADGITLFGYSGLDTHVNDLIALEAPTATPIRVVEWSGAGGESERRAFWRKRLKRQTIDLIRRDNILTFTDWAA